MVHMLQDELQMVEPLDIVDVTVVIILSRLHRRRLSPGDAFVRHSQHPKHHGEARDDLRLRHVSQRFQRPVDVLEIPRWGEEAT